MLSTLKPSNVAAIPVGTSGAPNLPRAPQAPRPPKAPPPRKAATAAECERLEQLPNVGPAIAADLRLIGIQHPAQLAEADAFALYQVLQRATGKRQDPCVLDSFIAACAFMRGAPAQPWWAYTAGRKQRFGVV